MTAKSFYDAGGAVCTSAMAEPRGLLDEEALTPVDAGSADARDRWGTLCQAEPGAEADDGAYSVRRFARAWALEERAAERRAPISIVRGPARAPRNRRPDLLTEIEQFVAAGQPELAAERLLSAILTAGLAATLSAPAPALPEPTPIRPSATATLTQREHEVAMLIAEGRTNRSIADELFISPSTVERHVANIFNKMGFHSRVQVAAWALGNGQGAARLELAR